ncbi:MAG: Unknown protein [uncultured Sulfurovum sp.]|uniref:DUF1800 domain-containing protein n=1 Tax=uncultured Sulfurovum sp. TaxID=269237 RepID=A0A6S6T3W2_9BACT|nr:MAG: Unknown protein [uncultured Sulfurovum sp.]
MKKILIGLACFAHFSFAETLNLQSGWNLIGINAPLTFDEIKNQIGEENLLVVQGPIKTYQKKYVDENKAFLNDFEGFETGKGYWVEVGTPSQLTYSELENEESSYNLSLKEGWNLLNAPVTLTLKELLEQIGEENLLVVQGANHTYQRNYIEAGNGHLNDFEALSLNGGYWIKVASDVNLEFAFNVDKPAVDNSGRVLVESMEFNNTTYSVKIYTNVYPSSSTSTNTISISGLINNVDTASIFKLNSNYALESHFVVKVFDANNEEVGSSSKIKYLTPPIDFGTINFKIESQEESLPNQDSEFQGVNVFSSPMTYNDYNLQSITDSYFNGLSIENKRLVASKLLSVLFYGLPENELNDLINSGTFISTIQEKLATTNSDLVSVEAHIETKNYSGTQYHANREKILARLLHLDLGKEYVNRWIAYVLTQNIMFSPANELETVDASDILNVYNRLVMLMDDDYSMEMITYLHMTSDDNWKRFRSPEDNGREMLEIFLLDFNDSHVPKAGIALKNWKLNRQDNELIIGLNQNDAPQDLFGTTITTGFDFYRELVKSSNFTKGVVARLVSRYFPQVSAEKKSEIIQNIVSSNPNSFKDILLQIVFSKEFLLNTERVKTVEESTYGIAKSISFHDHINFFMYMRVKMDNMRQSPLSYKLGRKNAIAVDTLSFAEYYDFIRRYVLNDYKYSHFNEYDGGWKVDFINKDLSGTSTINGLIHYIFNSIIARDATDEELKLLGTYAAIEARSTYDNMSLDNDRLGVTLVVMEYLSRLSETYTFKKIEE